MQPDSTLLVVLLLLLAGGAGYAAVHYRHLVVKIGSGVLALLFAMVSGVAVVNVYYGYYQTWGALSADLTNSYANFAPAGTHGKTNAVAGQANPADQLPGTRSRISREAAVYLPPQYFQRLRPHPFPGRGTVTRLTGQPGELVLQINIQSIMDQLINKRLVGPMIVVMPSIDPQHGFQECVDAPGALDDTYISQDVPAAIRARYRASLVPAEWGIGGYSSGGYCAANLVLRHRASLRGRGVLDGYFRPIDGPAAAALHRDRRLRSPERPLGRRAGPVPRRWPAPAFWISAGTASAKYNLGARLFVKALHGIIA